MDELQLNFEELNALFNATNAGIAALGINAFQNNNGIVLQSALNKLQGQQNAIVAAQDAKDEAEQPDKGKKVK